MFHGKPKQAKTRIFTAFLRNATFGPFLASETSQNKEGRAVRGRFAVSSRVYGEGGRMFCQIHF